MPRVTSQLRVYPVAATMVWIVGMADNGGGKRSSSGGASGDVPKEKPHKRSKSQGQPSLMAMTAN